MSDIVQRLREQGHDAFAKQYSLGMWKLCAEAATEIERLRGIVDVMRTDCIYAEDQWAKAKIALANSREITPNQAASQTMPASGN